VSQGPGRAGAAGRPSRRRWLGARRRPCRSPREGPRKRESGRRVTPAALVPPRSPGVRRRRACPGAACNGSTPRAAPRSAFRPRPPRPATSSTSSASSPPAARRSARSGPAGRRGPRCRRAGCRRGLRGGVGLNQRSYSTTASSDCERVRDTRSAMSSVSQLRKRNVGLQAAGRVRGPGCDRRRRPQRSRSVTVHRPREPVRPRSYSRGPRGRASVFDET
jgi:hypothetical protein